MLERVVIGLLVVAGLQFRSVEAFVFASPFILFLLVALVARRYVWRKLGRSFFELNHDEIDRTTVRVRFAAVIQYLAGAAFFFALCAQYLEVHTFHYEGGGPQEDSGGPAPVHGVSNPDAVCSDRWMPRLARNGARVMGTGFVLDSVERCEIPY